MAPPMRAVVPLNPSPRKLLAPPSPTPTTRASSSTPTSQAFSAEGSGTALGTPTPCALKTRACGSGRERDRKPQGLRRAWWRELFCWQGAEAHGRALPKGRRQPSEHVYRAKSAKARQVEWYQDHNVLMKSPPTCRPEKQDELPYPSRHPTAWVGALRQDCIATDEVGPHDWQDRKHEKRRKQGALDKLRTQQEKWRRDHNEWFARRSKRKAYSRSRSGSIGTGDFTTLCPNQTFGSAYVVSPTVTSTIGRSVGSDGAITGWPIALDGSLTPKSDDSTPVMSDDQDDSHSGVSRDSDGGRDDGTNSSGTESYEMQHRASRKQRPIIATKRKSVSAARHVRENGEAVLAADRIRASLGEGRSVGATASMPVSLRRRSTASATARMTRAQLNRGNRLSAASIGSDMCSQSHPVSRSGSLLSSDLGLPSGGLQPLRNRNESIASSMAPDAADMAQRAVILEGNEDDHSEGARTPSPANGDASRPKRGVVLRRDIWEERRTDFPLDVLDELAIFYESVSADFDGTRAFPLGGLQAEMEKTLGFPADATALEAEASGLLPTGAAVSDVDGFELTFASFEAFLSFAHDTSERVVHDFTEVVWSGEDLAQVDAVFHRHCNGHRARLPVDYLFNAVESLNFDEIVVSDPMQQRWLAGVTRDVMAKRDERGVKADLGSLSLRDFLQILTVALREKERERRRHDYGRERQAMQAAGFDHLEVEDLRELYRTFLELQVDGGHDTNNRFVALFQTCGVRGLDSEELWSLRRIIKEQAGRVPPEGVAFDVFMHCMHRVFQKGIGDMRPQGNHDVSEEDLEGQTGFCAVLLRENLDHLQQRRAPAGNSNAASRHGSIVSRRSSNRSSDSTPRRTQLSWAVHGPLGSEGVNAQAVGLKLNGMKHSRKDSTPPASGKSSAQSSRHQSISQPTPGMVTLGQAAQPPKRKSLHGSRSNSRGVSRSNSRVVSRNSSSGNLGVQANGSEDGDGERLCELHLQGLPSSEAMLSRKLYRANSEETIALCPAANGGALPGRALQGLLAKVQGAGAAPSSAGLWRKAAFPSSGRVQREPSENLLNDALAKLEELRPGDSRGSSPMGSVRRANDAADD